MTANSSAPRTATGSSANPCSSAHSGTRRISSDPSASDAVAPFPREGRHRDDGQDGRDHRNRPPRRSPLAAPVVERQADEEDGVRWSYADGGDDDRLGPLEDPQEAVEEVEVPVGARDEIGRCRIGGLGVEQPEDARLDPVGVPVPDHGQADDHEHDDESHDRVVQHREGVERLPLLLDVVLVPRVLLAAQLAEIQGAITSHPPSRGRALPALPWTASPAAHAQPLPSTTEAR